MPKVAAQREAAHNYLEDPSDLESLIGYNLKRAYVLAHNDFRTALDADGPSTRVFSALSMIVKFPNITQIALARMMGIERSGLVAVVDELETNGYLRRAPVPGDRRVQALVPTDAGVKAYKKTLAAVRAHEDAFFSDLSAAEKDQLIELLRKIRRRETKA